MRTIPFKVVLLSLWMFIGGPFVWGAWMIWKLGLYRPSEFLACLFPIGLGIQVLFLAAHFASIFRVQRPDQDSQNSIRKSLDFAVGLIAVFGSVATLAFLALPVVFGLAGTLRSTGDWLPRAFKGAIAGLSLVGMFYPFFLTNIHAVLSDSPASALSFSLQRFALLGFSTGLGGYLTTILLCGVAANTQILSVLGLIFPPVMGVFLLVKTLQITSTWRMQ